MVLLEPPDQLLVVVTGALTDHGNSLLSALFTLILLSTRSTTRGRSKVEAVGMRVFVLRDMCLCAGLDPMVSTGVFLYSNRAIHGFFPSRNAFLNRLLVIFTSDSAFPFDL